MDADAVPTAAIFAFTGFDAEIGGAKVIVIGALVAPIGADPAMVGADAGLTSLGRRNWTRIVKFATLRWSLGDKARLPATISTSSGLVSQGLL